MLFISLWEQDAGDPVGDNLTTKETDEAPLLKVAAVAMATTSPRLVEPDVCFMSV